MGKVNAGWHRSHVLGTHASLDDRVAWHMAHARECACREMPAAIRAEIERRGMSDQLPGDASAADH